MYLYFNTLFLLQYLERKHFTIQSNKMCSTREHIEHNNKFKLFFISKLHVHVVGSWIPLVSYFLSDVIDARKFNPSKAKIHLQD